MSIASDSYIVYCGHDSECLSLLREGLADEEFRLASVASAEELLKILQGEPRPDLLILDSTCLEGDLSHLTEALHALQLKTTALLALIADDEQNNESLITGFYERGFHDVLIKPVRLAYLKTKVRVWAMRMHSERQNTP